MADYTNEVIYIQWTTSGTRVSGSAQVETLHGSPPNEEVGSTTVSVDGSVDGSTIALSFDSGAKVFGRLSDNSFTINFPQSDGSLSPVTFTNGTTAQFNSDLNRLRGDSDRTDQNAADALALAKQRATISAAASAVDSDISTLGGGDSSSLQNDLGAFSGALQQAQNDLATVATQEQTVKSEAANGTPRYQVCADAGTATADAGTVAADGGSVSADAGSLEVDISNMRRDVTALQSDFANYQNAQNTQASFDPSNAPTQVGVGQAVSAAEAAIDNAISVGNGYINQANQYQVQADADAAEAAQAGGCSPPATNTTQTTIPAT